MASKKARKLNQAEKKPRRSHFKKQPTTTLDQTSSSSSIVSSTTTSFSPQETTNSPTKLMVSQGGCCTPKSQKSRIPEMLTCPPAPMKQRVTQNRLLRRRQIVFFASPEIELFFVNAHHDR